MASAKVANAKLKRPVSTTTSEDPLTDQDEEISYPNLDEAISYPNMDELELLKTIGTGTFGRVVQARKKDSKHYMALKVMSIAEIIRLKQADHIKSEKEILSQSKHPFIVTMHWTHHDEKFLYMLMEFVPGGELFSYLRTYGFFKNADANFYACEIVSALDFLHSRQIVYRDLKPENLLLDSEGHMKITDFGFAKKVFDRTWTLCGTPEYLAPEIIQSKGHNKAVDWWSLGVLIYEMLVGFPPFYDENPFGIYQKILAGKIEWSKALDPVAKDLIKKLLVHDRTRRLGNMKFGAEDVKRHRWFKGVNWEDVYNRKLKPPILPKLSFSGDTQNFDEYNDDNWQDAAAVDEETLDIFSDF